MIKLIITSLFIGILLFGCSRDPATNESTQAKPTETPLEINQLQDSLAQIQNLLKKTQDSLYTLQVRKEKQAEKPTQPYTSQQPSARLKKDSAALSVKITALKAELDSTIRAYKKPDKEKLALREKLSTTEQSAQMLRDSLERVKAERTSLLTSLQQTQNQLAGLSDTSDQNEYFIEKLTRLKADSVQLANKVNQSQTALATLENERDQLVIRLEARAADQPKTTNHIDSLRHLLNLEINKTQDLTNQLNNLRQSNQFKKAPVTPTPSTKADPSEKLSEAFRLLLLAQKAEPNNPTLALKLITHASTLSQDSIVQAHQTRIVETYSFYENILQLDEGITSFSMGADRLIAGVGSGVAHYYQFDGQAEWIRDFQEVTSVCISDSKKALIMGHPDGFISTYNISRESIAKKTKVHNGSVTAVSILGNPQYFYVTGSQDKTAQVLDRSYKKVSRMVGMRGGVTNISVQPRSGLIATACGDLNPRIWSSEGKLLLKLTDQADSTLSVALSPSGKKLLATHANNTVKLWTSEGFGIYNLAGHQHAVCSSVFLDESTYATGDRTGMIIVWREGAIFKKLSGHTQQITSLYSPSPGILFSSSKDGTLKKWTLDGQVGTNLTELTKQEMARFGIKEFPN